MLGVEERRAVEEHEPHGSADPAPRARFRGAKSSSSDDALRLRCWITSCTSGQCVQSPSTLNHLWAVVHVAKWHASVHHSFAAKHGHVAVRHLPVIQKQLPGLPMYGS